MAFTAKRMQKCVSLVLGGALLGATLLVGGCSGTAESPVPPGTKSPAGYGQECKAGIYSCRTPYAVPLGSPCSCPGLGAPSYGNVH